MCLKYTTLTQQHCMFCRLTNRSVHNLNCQRPKKKPAHSGFSEYGVPTGIRTPVTTMKWCCPRPLDDGDLIWFAQDVEIGGAKRDRTADLYNAIVALSQLSYSPKAPHHEAGILFSEICLVKCLACKLRSIARYLGN